MCGIAGIVHWDKKPIDISVLEKMDDLYNTVDLTMTVCKLVQVWGLVHRRLSIIDFSIAGRQPTTNEDGTN